MQKEIIEKSFIHNGIVMKANFKKLSFDKVDNIVYEVIRVIDGVPLFLEEHIDRLNKSANLLNHDITNVLQDILTDTKKIILLNGNPNKNLKILLYNIDRPMPDYYIFFIVSNYPREDLYKSGIKTITYNAVRENPNAKIINNEFRKNINTKIKESNVYEALLINESGEISEGSRSNVFFVKNSKVYTSPGKKVLLGTTRKKILSICSDLNIDVLEEPVKLELLKDYDALFITGTSPKVLPISQVDKIKFDSPNNETVKKIMEAYEQIIKDYIQLHSI